LDFSLEAAPDGTCFHLSESIDFCKYASLFPSGANWCMSIISTEMCNAGLACTSISLLNCLSSYDLTALYKLLLFFSATQHKACMLKYCK